jgi:uncharacterized protein (TIGR03067 family)
MRFIFLALMASVAAVTPIYAQSKKSEVAKPSDLRKLAGVWYAVNEEFRGQTTSSEERQKLKITLTVKDNTFIFENVDENGAKRAWTGVATLDESATPKRFDWTGTGPKGAALVRLGIYELSATEFRLATVMQKKGKQDRALEFKSDPNNNVAIVTYRREPRSKPTPEQTASKEYESIKPLLTRFTHRAQAGPVIVYSDISKAFSESHAKHGEKVWKYYTKLHGKTPGDKTVFYYTRDEKAFNAIADRTGSVQLKNARLVAGTWNVDHMVWIIVPFEEPDFGTQLHELHHIFLGEVYGGESPWFREGIAMYLEEGAWGKNGDLVVNAPFGWHAKQVPELAAKRQLVPLGELVTMGPERFYDKDFHQHYGQAMVFLSYLMRQHPKAMNEIIGRINRGEIESNEQLLRAISGSLKMDMRTLEKNYINYAMQVR